MTIVPSQVRHFAARFTTVALGLIPPLLDGDQGVIQQAMTDAEFGSAVVLADFNGDGIDDLVVGRPGETVDGVPQAGRITSSLGTTSGWGPGPSASLDSLGANNDAGARFGTALAVGHFNDDALPDLAIGVPGQRIAGNALAGGVVVLYGRAETLFLDTDQPDFFSQLVLSGNAENGDRFGTALAVGDFDGNGIDDLAVGAPFENLDVSDAGSVNVIYGTASGLTVANDTLLSQDPEGVSSMPGLDDFFGAALVAGDFDGDEFDDLAVGVPGETIGMDDAGAVHIFRGSAGGVEVNDLQYWHGNVPSLATTAAEGDEMGFALSAGDYNGDGWGDLAIGRPGRDRSLDENGEILLIYGGSDGSGLDGSTARKFGVATDNDQNFDRFGEVLATGDFNRDGYDDLAVGQPLANTDDEANSGRVILLRGTRLNVISIILQVLDAGDFEVAPQAGAEFGASLATGTFRTAGGGDGLVIGEPLRDNGSPDTGAVYWITSGSIFSSDFERGLTRWSATLGD